ncbi:hypothetical protein Ssed_2141 [Shewanella sediminis HAW-EB3]|uniref:HTH luxR-type domain-containing protein n=1 Tax=Shewanella sediminis (strain HAW-EB3) TaxID=425104 RepID=A8FV77_SHESH|nr:hypothetical protein Ssed_2141 [Shewanella sediminis HAW-EB3]
MHDDSIQTKMCLFSQCFYLVTILTENCPLSVGIIQDFLASLEALGINGFFYGITSNINLGQVHPFKKLEKRLPLEMAKVHYAVFSDERTRLYRDAYLNVFARHDEYYFEKKVVGPNLWRQPDASQAQLLNLLKDNEINSRVAWLLPSKYHPSWMNMFMLHSSLSDQDLKVAIDENREKIDRLLQVYAEFFSSKYIHLLNPIFNFNCLTTTSIKILKLAAEGTSSPDIAKSLYLTERGVNYHIDRMKVLFGAKNRVQLISRAFQIGILNAMPQPSSIL